MKNVTDNMNKQLEQIIDMQTRALEPMRIFAGVTADAAEQVARKNYEVFGDVIEFSSKQVQVQLPLTADDLTEATTAQAAQGKAFVELMNSRATEYAELAQQFSSKFKDASDSAIASFK